MTRRVAEKGIVIVAAAGNLNNALPINARIRPGANVADLAKSPFVIMVAASSTNQTPGVYENYQVAPFSSRGDAGGGEHCYQPTVAAPGMEIKIGARTPGAGPNSTMSGTSAAAPFTCGVIAMMLQRNPSLTFEQVKARLQATAVKNPHYGAADYGAGFLNAEVAVLG